MPFVSEHNIARVSFLYALIVVAIMTFSTGALFIIRKSITLEQELTELEETFIKEQKSQLKTEVDKLIEQIDTSRRWTSSRIEKELAVEVETARNVVASLYESLKGQLPESKVEQVISEAVRPIHTRKRDGYCFIFRESGEAVVNAANPALEGSNLYLQGYDREPDVIDTLITIAREKGSGFYQYDWWKPGEPTSTLHPKISYVTWFAPLHWIIGSGEYTDDLHETAQSEVIDTLRNSLSSPDGDYFFIYKIHKLEGGDDFATLLINSNRPDLEGKKISDDYKDARGKPFRKEFLQGIRSTGESYVVYWYKKPDGTGISRKLSYFKLYPEWDWVVARGIYFDSLDENIATQKAKLRKKVRQDIMLLLALFTVAVSIALIVAFRFSSQLQDIFTTYRKEQDKNVKKLKGLNTILKEQNRTDGLTGIFNRSYLTRRLQDELKRAHRYGSPLSVILFDIDHFKNVNDNYGHLAGDSILQELATLIGENIRVTDTFARWGGEEFIILAPGITCEQAQLMAEKLRVLTAAWTFSTAIDITCSFGVSSYRDNEESQALLQRVDDALYDAKQNGRNQSVMI